MSDAALPPAPTRRPRSLAIHPSILSADFANLERELGRIATADLVHVDVMDNHFVPNLTLGLPVVERLAQVSPVPLDCHLMIADPDRWAPQYAEAGAASVTAHLEAVADPRRLVAALRAAGARPALAISPGTPVDALLPLLGALDMVLVMTVEPGFGGQSFREDCLPKVRALREAADREGVDLQIQVDGGVSGATIGACAEAGADVFVAGSAVYGAEDPAAAVDALRETARRAVGG